MRRATSARSQPSGVAWMDLIAGGVSIRRPSSPSIVALHRLAKSEAGRGAPRQYLFDLTR